MAVIFQTGYTLPALDEPLTHARIAHSGNWHSGATVTASTTDTAYFSDAPDNLFTYEKWKPATTTGTWEAAFGSAKTCDYAVIGAHTLGTSASTIKIQSWNGATWDDETPATAIATDEPIFCIFAPRSATKWRLNITAGTGIPQVAVIKFGNALQMERPLYGEYTPIRTARRTDLRSNDSETGEFLGRTIQRVSLEFQIGWSKITRTWFDTNWRPAISAFESSAFFLAPMPSVYGEVALCRTAGAIEIPRQNANGFLSVSLSIVARAYE